MVCWWVVMAGRLVLLCRQSSGRFGTELCGLWSKNIHSTWYQQFKGFAECKGVVAPGFPHVSKTRYVSYDNMAHIILHNSSLIGCQFGQKQVSMQHSKWHGAISETLREVFFHL